MIRPVPPVSAQLRALDAARWRIAVSLTLAMMVIYIGFILLIAYAKPLLAMPLAEGLSLGILLGALVIIVAWIVTGIYVVWANSRYDTKLEELRAAAREER